jgi:HAMP domain-containing protein
MPFNISIEAIAAIASFIVGVGGFFIGVWNTIRTNKRLDAAQTLAEKQAVQLVKRDEVTTLRETIDTLAQDNKRLFERLTISEKRADSAEMRADVAEKRADDAEKRADEFGKLVYELRAEIRKLNEKLETQGAELAELRTQNHQKDVTIARQNETIATQNNKLASLQCELDELKQKVADGAR